MVPSLLEVDMVCPYCGAELADEAQFCVGCGAALDGTEAMPVANPAVAPAPVGSPAPSKKPKKGVVIAIVCAAVIVVGGGGGLAYHLYQQHVQEQEQYESAHSKHALVVSVKAEGWDTDNGASRVPVRVKGKTVDGKKVDKVEYVASDGSGIKLIQGKYTLKAAGSPIAADGTIYAVPTDKFDIKLGEKAAEKKAVDAGDVTLEPVEASEVTDDQIAAAKKYAEGDEGAKKAGFNIDAEALSTAATKRRDDAVAAKQAEEEARRQAEEEARKAEEARQARTIETDYFTMVLPDWFPIDQFTVQTTDHADQGDGMGAYTMVLVTAKDSFYPNGKNNPNLCPNFGICADTNDLPGVGCAFYKELGNTQGHTVRVWGGSYGEWNGKTIDDRPFGMSGDDYANLLASCTTLK